MRRDILPLQGGGRAGQASIFIRLAKCNLACDFVIRTTAGVKMSLKVFKRLNRTDANGSYGRREPLQLTDDIVERFKERIHASQKERDRRVAKGIDYTQPKQYFEKVKGLFLKWMNCDSLFKRSAPDISVLPKQTGTC